MLRRNSVAAQKLACIHSEVPDRGICYLAQPEAQTGREKRRRGWREPIVGCLCVLREVKRKEASSLFLGFTVREVREGTHT